MKFLANYLPESFVRKYRKKRDDFKRKTNLINSKISRQFHRPPFPKLENGELYLHLGCGRIDHPEFINVDGLPAPHIHYIRAIDNLSCFQSDSVKLIYACHCLEHFSHLQVPSVLSEWRRVLKSDGILRISVPNFDLLVHIYQDNQRDIDSIMRPLMGAQNHQYNFHMTAFTRSSLENIFKEVGFEVVREWQPGKSELTTFPDWSNKQIFVNSKAYPVSLNLEAIK